MARMIAKCLFTVLLFQLMALPCSADESLTAVSIGGFTWNLNETEQVTSAIQYPSAGIEVASAQKLLLQTPNCQFAQVALARQELARQELARKGLTRQELARQELKTATDDSAVRFVDANPLRTGDRLPFSMRNCFSNATCPHECCFVVDQGNVNTIESPSATTPCFAGKILDRLASVDIHRTASSIVNFTSNKMTPIVTSLADGIFQTASWTAQYARFPMENFSIASVKSLEQNADIPHGSKGSDANPLRMAENLRPAMQPIEPSEIFDMSAVYTPFSNPLPLTLVASREPIVKTPERMDSYWNYYADCDRWNVVIAGEESDYIQPETSIGKTNSQFGFVSQMIATVSNLELWLSRAIRQLESQSNSIRRDFQTTWRDIKFRLIEVSFAKSKANTKNVKYSAGMLNRD